MNQERLSFSVKKHNKLIRTRQSSISTQSSKILQTLVANVQVSDSPLPFADVPVQNIFDLTDAGGEYYKRIKSCVDELGKCTISLEYENLHTYKRIYELFPIFAYIQYKEGIIYADFNPCLKEYFLAKKDFTLYNLFEFKSLKSSYSQRLFEILKSWQNISQGFKKIDLKELHNFLSVPESLKKDFSLFRKKVLELAYKDILKNTNLKYEWEPIKKGAGKTSPVIAIKFIFLNENKKEKLPLVEYFEKQEKENAVMLADKCRKIYGNNCTGGNQKEIVCTLCNLMNKKNLNN